MTIEPVSVARYAGLFADPSRMAMCLALIDGRAWTAGELARHVGISPSTASEHLTALVRAEVLTEERQGRHRYLRLAGPDVGQLVEDFATLAGAPIPAPTSLRSSRVAAEMTFARTCYDHLAGALAVALRERLEVVGYLADRPQGWRSPPTASGGSKVWTERWARCVRPCPDPYLPRLDRASSAPRRARRLRDPLRLCVARLDHAAQR